VRQLLVEHNGYECREESGRFLLAFHSATDATQFSLALQVNPKPSTLKPRKSLRKTKTLSPKPNKA
jgi:hypothetical protein